MLLHQTAILVLLVTCHGAPVQEERDSRSPELEAFGAQPPANQEAPALQGGEHVQEDLETGQGETDNVKVEDVPLEEIPIQPEASPESEVPSKQEDVDMNLLVDQLQEEMPETEQQDKVKGELIEDLKADVKTTEEQVLPESEIREVQEESTNEESVPNNDATDDQSESNDAIADQSVNIAEDVKQEEDLNLVPDVEEKRYHNGLFDVYNMKTREWYPASTYYGLWGNNLRRRRSAHPMALTAEDMGRGMGIGGSRIKRDLGYYPDDQYVDLDPRGMYPEEDEAPDEGQNWGEPFDDMSEVELIRALKILHRIYREEVERQREQEALQDLINYEYAMSRQPQDDEEYYPEQGFTSKRAYPMSLVPGSKRSGYSEWSYPREEKRGYEDWYPSNSASENEWYPEYNTDADSGYLSPSDNGQWGEFAEDRRNQEEYDRLMYLADALGYK